MKINIKEEKPVEEPVVEPVEEPVVEPVEPVEPVEEPAKGIIVKVKLPDKCLRDVFVEKGTTIADVLTIVGIDATCSFQLNGKPAEATEIVNEGAEIIFTPEIMVKIARLGDRVHPTYLKAGSTIAQAIQIAGVDDADENDIMYDGRECSLEDIVAEGGIITLIPKVKGGCCDCK